MYYVETVFSLEFRSPPSNDGNSQNLHITHLGCWAGVLKNLIHNWSDLSTSEAPGLAKDDIFLIFDINI